MKGNDYSIVEEILTWFLLLHLSFGFSYHFKAIITTLMERITGISAIRVYRSFFRHFSGKKYYLLQTCCGQPNKVKEIRDSKNKSKSFMPKILFGNKKAHRTSNQKSYDYPFICCGSNLIASIIDNSRRTNSNKIKKIGY